MSVLCVLCILVVGLLNADIMQEETLYNVCSCYTFYSITTGCKVRDEFMLFLLYGMEFSSHVTWGVRTYTLSFEKKLMIYTTRSLRPIKRKSGNFANSKGHSVYFVVIKLTESYIGLLSFTNTYYIL